MQNKTLKILSFTTILSLSVCMSSFAMPIASDSDAVYTTSFNSPNDEPLVDETLNDGEMLELTDEEYQRFMEQIDKGLVPSMGTVNTPNSFRGNMVRAFRSASTPNMNVGSREFNSFLDVGKAYGQDFLGENQTTVKDYSGCRIIVFYYKGLENKILLSKAVTVNSDGYADLSSIKNLGNGYTLFGYHIEVPSYVKPPFGKFATKVKVSCSENKTDGAYLKDCYVKLLKRKKNIALKMKVDTQSEYIVRTINHGLLFGCESNINSGGADYLYFEFYNRDYVPLNDLPPWFIMGLRFATTAQKSMTFDEGIDSEEAYYYENAQNTEEMASTMHEIAEGQNAILGSMKELMQHISNQLFAFWNQLAGEFTNLYAKLESNDDNNTNSIVNAIDNSSRSINNNINANTDREIANSNQNTNTVTNGYDNSSMTSSNDKLKEQIKQNEEAEKELTENINKTLSEHNYDITVFSSYLSCFKVLGEFLQSLFENSGNFADVIRFAFFMSTTMLAIGMYRFKGGA